MNEVAEINPGTWASLFAESPGPNADPTTGTPEADSLNVSGSGPRSTDIEPGADPKTKEETLKVMGNPEAELGTDALASGPQDLLEEDSPLAKAKVEVKSKTEERKPEVVREAESLDEASGPKSVTEGTPPLPDSKEESVEALEHKPHHATEDSIEGNPSIPSPGHYGRYKEKFDEKELPEHKKCIGSTVFQVILNSGGGYAERICYLE